MAREIIVNDDGSKLAINSSQQSGGIGRWFLFNERYTATLGTSAFTANVIRITPFVLRDVFNITELGVEVTTSAASGLARVGIYGCDSNLLPTDLILDAGAANCASTGAKNIVLASTLTLQPGWYFHALLSNSSTLAFRSLTASAAYGQIFGSASITSSMTCGFSTTFTYGNLPTTLGTLSDITSCPVVFFRKG